MSATQAEAVVPLRPGIGTVERYLSVWVALCIVVGIGLGQLAPSVFRAAGDATVAQVNLPVAALIWLMIVPMLLKIDLGSLRQVGGQSSSSILSTPRGALHCVRALPFGPQRP